MPIYDVSAVAEALGFDLKQMDNLLSRNELAGVERKTRGVSRRLSVDTAVVIRIATELAAVLNLSPGSLLRFAHEIQRSSSPELQLGTFFTLRVDLAGLRASTVSRLDSAVEAVGRRRRGRPPRQTRARELGP